MQPSWVRSQSSALIERDIWLVGLSSFPLLAKNTKRQGMEPCRETPTVFCQHVCCKLNPIIVWTREATKYGLEILDSHGGDAEASSLVV